MISREQILCILKMPCISKMNKTFCWFWKNGFKLFLLHYFLPICSEHCYFDENCQVIAALDLLTGHHNVYTELEYATFSEMKKRWVDSTVRVSDESDNETVIFVNALASRPPLSKTMMFIHINWRVKYFIFIHVDIHPFGKPRFNLFLCTRVYLQSN